MLTHRNLLMACFAALLALGLAACGTGSDGPATSMTDPDPTPDETPDETATALAAYDTAKTTYDAAIAAYQAGPSQMTADAAKDAADELKAAADTAAEAAANGNDAQKLAIAEAVIYANNAVTTAAGAVTDAKEAADAAAGAAADEETARLALVAYADAKTDYYTARTAYEGGMTQANAQALRVAAAELKAKADEAMAAAVHGTSAQQTAAAAAVTEADDAVEHAAIVLAAIQGGISETEEANLVRIQTAAANAATAAGTAATEAEDAATAAETAAADSALIQTGPNSATSATDARTHAGYARDAAGDAETAADEAAAATTVTEAEAAQRRAETAQQMAEDHRGHVATRRDAAVDAALNEVKVVEGGYKVGDTTLMVDAARNVVTVTVNDEEQTMITGKLADLGFMHPDDAFTGLLADPDADPPVAYRQAVAARIVNIGVDVDSADDTARLRLITHYNGSRMVNVYAIAAATDLTGAVAGNRIDTTPTDMMDDEFTTLTAVGMFYLAGELTDTNGLDQNDQVAAETKAAQQVYSYTPEGGTVPILRGAEI